MEWKPKGCGKCWKVTGPGAVLVLKGANFYPTYNPYSSDYLTHAHFDIAAPGFHLAARWMSNCCWRLKEEEAMHDP